MSMTLHIQNMTDSKRLPDEKQFRQWAEQALTPEHGNAEITLRIVDEQEGQALNNTWRNRDNATNVLSFPVGEPIAQAPELLGDIVICAPVVEREASEQGKASEAHWAHLTVHGVLHLQGFDHESDDDAEIMETMEIQILNNMGYPNPYEDRTSR